MTWVGLDVHARSTHGAAIGVVFTGLFALGLVLVSVIPESCWG
jgi:ABC-type Mn2+/Zn2+ transport system permease subunit